LGPLGVVFGGPSPEHDVSVLTGLQAAHALQGCHREVVAIYWDKHGDFHQVGTSLEPSDFLAAPVRASRPLQLVAGPRGGFFPARRALRPGRLELEALVNCCHGGPGEDGSLQAALDLAGVPYTGPTAAGAALAMDKAAFGAVVAQAGLPQLPRLVLDEKAAPDFPGPYIVKPRFGGSSIGVEVVADLPTARARLGANPHLAQGAVLEPYRPELFDLQVAARSWPKLELSAIERPLRTDASAAILGYSDKYVGGQGMVSAPRELPAQVAPVLADQLRQAAFEVARLCQLRGVARLDFLSDGEQLYVNEVNTVPGSLAKYLWIDPPVAFTDLLEAMVAEALARPARRYCTEGADGSALRSAGTIASKLG